MYAKHYLSLIRYFYKIAYEKFPMRSLKFSS